MACAALQCHRSDLLIRRLITSRHCVMSSSATSGSPLPPPPPHRHRSCNTNYIDVFINHRGVDTKRTVAGLLYDRLVQLNLRPFLDNRSMEPGDKLFDSINTAILGCKVGIAIFSPRYCQSPFCLHELAMLVDAKKKLIPIFCDVKPSELHLPPHHMIDHTTYSPEKLESFRNALQEAKYTVGLTFDSLNGNWSDLVTRTANIVLKSIQEESDHY